MGWRDVRDSPISLLDDWKPMGWRFREGLVPTRLRDGGSHDLAVLAGVRIRPKSLPTTQVIFVRLGVSINT